MSMTLSLRLSTFFALSISYFLLVPSTLCTVVTVHSTLCPAIISNFSLTFSPSFSCLSLFIPFSRLLKRITYTLHFSSTAPTLLISFWLVSLLKNFLKPLFLSNSINSIMRSLEFLDLDF